MHSKRNGYEIVATGNFRKRGQKPENGNFVTSSTSLPTYVKWPSFLGLRHTYLEDKPMRFFSLLFLITKEYLTKKHLTSSSCWRKLSLMTSHQQS